MSEPDLVPRELAQLREQNLELSQRLADAQQAFSALARGQVDAVAQGASATPILLEAAQEQLRNNRKLLRAIFDGAIDALLLDDDLGAHVDVNAAACELFGLTRADLLGRRLVDSVTQVDSGAERPAPGPEGRRLDGHYVLQRPDGARRILDYRAVADVAPGLHLVALRDTTEQATAEDALRRSEARFRAMIEKSHDGISLLSADARTLYQSPAVERLLGHSGVDARQTSLEDLIDEDERPRLRRAFTELLDTPSSTTVLELSVVHRDGSRRWLQLSATNLLHDPDVGALVANFRDITERKRFEAELRETEQRYRRLIEELPEPVLVHVDSAIAFANAASARALGLESAGQLIGRSLAEFATPDTRARIVEHTVNVGRDSSLELGQQSFLRASDGMEVHAEVKSIPFVYDGRAATLSITSDVTRRVEAEREASAALRQADIGRRKLEAVLAALPTGVWIADAGGLLTQINPAASRIWGGRAPHADNASEYGVYRGYWPGTTRQLRPEEWAMARSVLEGATVVAEAVTIERFDGTVGHVLNSSAPILDESGRTVGGVAVMLDVSSAHETAVERERLIASLEFERRRLGTLLEKAPAFIAVLRGKEHVFELVNDAYMDLIGHRDALGRSVSEVIPEIRSQGFIELMDNVISTGEPFVANAMAVMLSRTRGAAAERRYVDFVYQPVVESDGTISGVFLHGVDVTTAVLAKQRVRAQFHAVPVPTYVWQHVERAGQMQFVLTDFNQAAVAFSHGDVAEHLGESAEVYFSDAPESLRDLELCLEQGNTHTRELDWVVPGTNDKRRVYVTYAPAPPDLVIVHAADITDRIKMEQQLRQAQKMEAVGRLAGGIAHDFNNLLSVILSYAELSMEGLNAGDPLRKDLEQIQQAGRRATDLTRQLLAFSRQQVLEPRVIAVDKIVTAMRPMLGRLLGEDVELTVLPEPSVGLVLADPGQIEQVVMNLAVNARDAMPQGGKLTIEVANRAIRADMPSKPDSVAPGPFVVLGISDSGLGMDAATQARIFEPFFTTKEVGKGTGLGLSTVFGIVHQSGGFISVSSELGHGSTFKVYLPRTDRVSETLPPFVVGPHARRGSETILLVEDEEQVRAVACAILRRSGYRVIETSNGGEAFLASQDAQGMIDLLFTDVVMPRMSGRKLAEQLALTRPEMKVLFASGYTDDVIIRHGVVEQGFAFLQKPFTPDSLLAKVREVLDER